VKSIKTKIDGNTIQTIASLYTNGKKPSARIYRDSVCPGLIISVGPRGASWKISTNAINALISGKLSRFQSGDIESVRQMVTEVVLLQKSGKDFKTLIATFAAEKNVELAKDVQAVYNGKGMLWEAARDKFIAWAYTEYSDDTVHGYKSALGACENSSYKTEFEPLEGKPVHSITFEDVSAVIQNMTERGNAGKAIGKTPGRRQTNLTLFALKSCFRYFTHNPRTYFMSGDPTRDLGPRRSFEKKDRKNKDYQKKNSAKKNRAMTHLEIGGFVHALGSVDNPIARMALWFELLTGQRLLDSCSAMKEAFVENAAYGLVWRLEDKTRSWRALPLGPLAADIIRRSLVDFAAFETSFVFPKEKVRRKGDDPDGHIHKRTVSDKMHKMRFEGGALHGSTIDPSTHDLRKAFTSYMAPRMSKFKDENGEPCSKADTAIITHKNEGRDATASAVYDKNEYLDTKYAILCEWEDYVMQCYKAYLVTIEPLAQAA